MIETDYYVLILAKLGKQLQLILLRNKNCFSG